MEERFGVPLIERTSKKFNLTREGELLNDRSWKILHLYDGLHNEFKELNNIIAGCIRVATVYSIGLHELPHYLRVFLKNYPEVNVHVEYRRNNQVYDDILEGTVDIGLVAFPVAKKNIKMEIFKNDRLVLITSPNHALANKEEVELEGVAMHKLVGFDADIPTRKAIDKFFEDASLPNVTPVMEFDNVETVKRAVEIDVGVSIVPHATVEQEVRNGSLRAIELTGGDFSRPLGILYRSGRIFSPAIKRFLEMLRESGNGAETVLQEVS